MKKTLIVVIVIIVAALTGPVLFFAFIKYMNFLEKLFFPF